MSSISVLAGPRQQRRGRVGDYAELDMYGHVDEENFPQNTGKANQVFTINVEDLSLTSGDVVSLKIHENYILEYTADGTLATDLADLTTAIQADPIFNGAIETIASFDSDASTADDSLRLTARAAGYEVVLEDGGTGDVVVTVVEETEESFGDGLPFGRAAYVVSGFATLTKPAGSIEDVLEGVTRRLDSRQSEVLGESAAEANPRRDVVIIRTGRVVVADGADASRGDQIFIGTTAGAELGRFFTASGAGRTALPLSAGKWIEPHVIELKLGK